MNYFRSERYINHLPNAVLPQIRELLRLQAERFFAEAEELSMSLKAEGLGT